MAFAPDICPHCKFSHSFIKKGFFRIKRTNQTVRRYQCTDCLKTFSSRTFKPDYRHKKKDLNQSLLKLLTEGMSLRSSARTLGLTYNNTCKKFLWLSLQAEKYKEKLRLKAQTLLFDEMETIHHTKCKPLSIAIAVNEKYEILALNVAEMPAKGHLAKISVLKYGKRNDQRDLVMHETLKSLSQRLEKTPELIISDAKSSYRKLVEKFFYKTQYEVCTRVDKDRHRDRLHEHLEKRPYDAMFSLNQRCALLRDRIKRLARRSWCTTKKVENLQKHLDMFLVSQFI